MSTDGQAAFKGHSLVSCSGEGQGLRRWKGPQGCVAAHSALPPGASRRHPPLSSLNGYGT